MKLIRPFKVFTLHHPQSNHHYETIRLSYVLLSNEATHIKQNLWSVELKCWCPGPHTTTSTVEQYKWYKNIQDLIRRNANVYVTKTLTVPYAL